MVFTLCNMLIWLCSHWPRFKRESYMHFAATKPKLQYWMCFLLRYKKYDLQRCSHNVMVITRLDTVKSYFDSQTFIFVVPICQNSFDPPFYQLPFYFIFLFAFVQLKIKKFYDIFFFCRRCMKNYACKATQFAGSLSCILIICKSDRQNFIHRDILGQVITYSHKRKTAQPQFWWNLLEFADSIACVRAFFSGTGMHFIFKTKLVQCCPERNLMKAFLARSEFCAWRDLQQEGKIKEGSFLTND